MDESLNGKKMETRYCRVGIFNENKVQAKMVPGHCGEKVGKDKSTNKRVSVNGKDRNHLKRQSERQKTIIGP